MLVLVDFSVAADPSQLFLSALALAEDFHAPLQATKLYHPQPEETFSKPHETGSKVQ